MSCHVMHLLLQLLLPLALIDLLLMSCALPASLLESPQPDVYALLSARLNDFVCFV